jgi:hypothetical protein
LRPRVSTSGDQRKNMIWGREKRTSPLSIYKWAQNPKFNENWRNMADWQARDQLINVEATTEMGLAKSGFLPGCIFWNAVPQWLISFGSLFHVPRRPWGRARRTPPLYVRGSSFEREVEIRSTSDLGCLLMLYHDLRRIW